MRRPRLYAYFVILFSCVLQETPPNYNESQYIADTRSPPSYTQGTFVNGKYFIYYD